MSDRLSFLLSLHTADVLFGDANLRDGSMGNNFASAPRGAVCFDTGPQETAPAKLFF